MSEKAELVVEGKKLSVSNLDKVLYPKVGFTKGQVIDYYIRIAPALLPHLQDRPLAARFVRRNEIEIIRQDERLKRFAGLRPAQHAREIRSNQGFIPRARATFGTRTWKPCDLEHVESGAKRKSVRRLEPERRTQDHNLRLLSPRQGRADRFNAGKLRRSGQLFDKEKSQSPEIPLRQDSRSRRI